jgi:hypothetical protein
VEWFDRPGLGGSPAGIHNFFLNFALLFYIELIILSHLAPKAFELGESFSKPAILALAGF